jgi:hypothetical protein
MEAEETEPPVTHKKLKVKEFWKRGRTAREIIVSSGPLPSQKDSAAVNAARDRTQGEVEETQSPTYPTDKLPIERDVPMGGVPSGDRD